MQFNPFPVMAQEQVIKERQKTTIWFSEANNPERPNKSVFASKSKPAPHLLSSPAQSRVPWRDMYLVEFIKSPPK